VRETRTKDVVVIGGGCFGLASAIALAARGMKVTLVERGLPSAANSTRHRGGICQQFGTELNIRLSQLSAETWAEFAERYGVIHSSTQSATCSWRKPRRRPPRARRMCGLEQSRRRQRVSGRGRDSTALADAFRPWIQRCRVPRGRRLGQPASHRRRPRPRGDRGRGRATRRDGSVGARAVRWADRRRRDHCRADRRRCGARRDRTVGQASAGPFECRRSSRRAAA